MRLKKKLLIDQLTLPFTKIKELIKQECETYIDARFKELEDIVNKQINEFLNEQRAIAAMSVRKQEASIDRQDKHITVVEKYLAGFNILLSKDSNIQSTAKTICHPNTHIPIHGSGILGES